MQQAIITSHPSGDIPRQYSSNQVIMDQAALLYLGILTAQCTNKGEEQATMEHPPEPRREHPSTYFVQDRRNENELARVTLQDQMYTAAMGGILPEQPDPSIFHQVLDVACGTGSWIMETAKTYPTISRLAGVDISGRMIEYARSQAAEQQLSDRVEFFVMDALRMLEFPQTTFDLVNMRLSTSFMRTWDWPKMLQEFQRVTRTGGLVRITETDLMIKSSSLALMRFYEIGKEAFANAGHLFSPKSNGITQDLEPLMRQHGLRDIQTRTFAVEFRPGSPGMQLFYEDMEKLFQVSLPFIQKWGHVPEDYSDMQQQALIDMQQPDFFAIGNNLTAWGKSIRRKL